MSSMTPRDSSAADSTSPGSRAETDHVRDSHLRSTRNLGNLLGPVAPKRLGPCLFRANAEIHPGAITTPDLQNRAQCRRP